MNELLHEKQATLGWLTISAFALIWNAFSEEQLSEGVDRALEHPIGRIITIATIGAVAVHLVNLPEQFGLEKYDPLHRVANIFNEGEQNG